jgi:hypothetical protein
VYIHEEVTRKLHSGNASYHSAQNIFSSRQLQENVTSEVIHATGLEKYRIMRRRGSNIC